MQTSHLHLLRRGKTREVLLRRGKTRECSLGEAAQLLLYFHSCGGKPCESAGEVVRPLLSSTSRVHLS